MGPCIIEICKENLQLGSPIENEDPDSITEEDEDDNKESPDGILAPWDDTIWKFLLL
ncbi:22738_t:CDS:2 [Dentiscutata erythropus]|uniref:22738_t:CDS:1 n=1 Tax=Dentiscutata erythropus TaxID=1348616 RepID=A0A9N9ATY4_9GLOM|nr:22738_t:CDS:2 [Dentiscutata erythropus]